MNLKVICRHFDHTKAIDETIQSKAEHLKKFFQGKLDIVWVCSVNNNLHRSEVNVHASHWNFYAHAEDETLYKTFDLVIEKLEKQLRRKYDRLKDKTVASIA